MSETLGLIARLRKFGEFAKQQCQCPSDMPNCTACDCALAADEIKRLRAALRDIVEAFDRAAPDVDTLEALLGKARKEFDL